MNKKIIQSLFTNIVAKDELRPVLSGVHFEEERCYASDGHVLVVYKESKPGLEGKTLAADGNAIDGRYPKVDGVIPAKENWGTQLKIDMLQLRNACQWQTRQEGANVDDTVVIGEVGYGIRTLLRLCNVMLLGGDVNRIKFYNSDKTHATIITGKKLLGLIMPMIYREEDIDAEREFEGVQRTYSYENLINDYVFNSWKKAEKKDTFSWLD